MVSCFDFESLNLVMHFAHSTDKPDRSDWQPLVEHLDGVGQIALRLAEKFRAGKAAYLAGLFHDLGKYSTAFQLYIQKRGGSVDHSTAGAREVLDIARTAKTIDRVMAQLVAYAIAGHHAGLPDGQLWPGNLKARVADKSVEKLDPIWREQVAGAIDGLFPPGLRLLPDKAGAAFQIALLGRMIFSCLVDADRLNTEYFYANLQNRVVDREWPELPATVARLGHAFDAYMAEKQAKAPDTPVNRLRAEILTHVRGKAAMPRGVFTLTVPTGGGKTLASLAFALDHARHHEMQRIVVAIPFTSVIDQTASIFKKVLGDDVVLEHHSAIEQEKLGRDEPRDKRLLAMENWTAPIVVTTNVQLFESLFSERPSRCRKLHNLNDAVIVLDEAQTIPLHVLRPCVAVLDELARNYGCTIVLCTATQPALAQPEFAGGFLLGPGSELAPDPLGLHDTLRRFRLRFAGVMTDDDLVAAVTDHPQSLVVVNGRAHALKLFQMMNSAHSEGTVHLTTRQTAADRRIVLAEVRRRLSAGQRCRLIATSLVEAGVDLDFPRAWRAEAGLDQIAQIGGRVNREGLRNIAESIVTVFTSAEAKPPAEIAGFIGDMDRMRDNHADDPLSPAAMRDYFGEVYWRKGDAGLDRIPAKDLDGGDTTIKVMVDAFSIGGGETFFDYRRVGQGFRLIQSGLAPVIIAIDEAPRKAVEGLRGGWLTAGAAARALQPYIVQVPPKALQKLLDNGHVKYAEGFGDQFAVLRTESLYTRDIGLLWDDADYLGLETMIV